MFRLWFVLALSLLAGSTRALTLVLDPSSPQQREVYEELAARFGKLRPDIKLQAYVIEPESYKKQMVESLGSSQPMGICCSGLQAKSCAIWSARAGSLRWMISGDRKD